MSKKKREVLLEEASTEIDAPLQIVVNKCYGGFGLSVEALKMYYELKGITPFFYSRIYDKDGNAEEYKRIKTSTEETGLSTHVVDTDLGPICSDKDLSDRKKCKYLSDSGIERDDPALVKVVKKLKKKANGKFAELHITTIPAGVNWEIGEYDGQEWVDEKHRSW